MSTTSGLAARGLLAFVLLTFVHAVHADTAQQPSEWSFTIAPYAWLAGTGGTIVTDGDETDFELSFDDVLELTTGGFQVNAQARYGRFFVTFDGTWAQLGHGEDLLGGRIDFSVKQTIAELQGGFRLLGPQFRPASPDSRSYIRGAAALDAYVGIRYWRTDLALNVDLPGLPPLVPPTQTEVSDADEWYEPIVGARLGLGLTEKIGVAINATLGGFGVADAAELTWTLSLFVDWRFGKKWSAAFGWRTQGVDDISGTGVDRNGSKIVTTGPIVGLVYSF